MCHSLKTKTVRLGEARRMTLKFLCLNLIIWIFRKILISPIQIFKRSWAGNTNTHKRTNTRTQSKYKMYICCKCYLMFRPRNFQLKGLNVYYSFRQFVTINKIKNRRQLFFVVMFFSFRSVVLEFINVMGRG